MVGRRANGTVQNPLRVPSGSRAHKGGRPGGTTPRCDTTTGHGRTPAINRAGRKTRPRRAPHHQDETAPRLGALHHTNPGQPVPPKRGTNTAPGTTRKPGTVRPQRNPTPTRARSRPRTATGQASPPLRHAPTQRNVIHKYTVGQLHPEFLRSFRTGTRQSRQTSRLVPVVLPAVATSNYGSLLLLRPSPSRG